MGLHDTLSVPKTRFPQKNQLDPFFSCEFVLVFGDKPFKLSQNLGKVWEADDRESMGRSRIFVSMHWTAYVE